MPGEDLHKALLLDASIKQYLPEAYNTTLRPFEMTMLNRWSNGAIADMLTQLQRIQNELDLKLANEAENS